MTILGMILKPPASAKQLRHAGHETVKGPSSDVTIANGGTGEVTVSIAGESPRDILYAGVESITGLPGGVYIAGISVDKTAKTLTLTLYNGSGGDVTITANSLTITVVWIS